MNFFKPTKVTWAIFLLFASVTVFLPLLFLFFVLIWSFGLAGSEPLFTIETKMPPIQILEGILRLVALGAGEYFIACVFSKLFYSAKGKSIKKQS